MSLISKGFICIFLFFCLFLLLQKELYAVPNVLMLWSIAACFSHNKTKHWFYYSMLTSFAFVVLQSAYLYFWGDRCYGHEDYCYEYSETEYVKTLFLDIIKMFGVYTFFCISYWLYKAINNNRPQ